MTEPSTVGASSGSSVSSSGSTSDSSTAAASTPESAEATRMIDASRQGGVVNPGELARDLAASYARDPDAAAAVHAAVDAELDPRDQASLNEHLAAELGAAAGATAAARGPVNPDTVTAYRVEGVGNGRVEVGPDGSISVPEVRTQRGRGPERNLYVNFGDEARAQAFLEQRLQQFPDNRIKTFEVPRSFVEELRATAVPEAERGANPSRPVIADPTKARDQFGLSGEQIQTLRDVAVQGTGQADYRPPSAVATTVRAAGTGALAGAAVDAALTTDQALADGRISGDEARDILANSARGAVVGGTYAVTEQGLVRVADRAAGGALERGATAAATRLGAAEAGAVGAATRTVATRLGGAGAAGAVISAGFSAYENRAGLARGDSQAIGTVAGDVVVGASAALGGAAAGAAVGSVVPVVGTAVGAVVGLGVGVAADYVMRAGGVDKAVANVVSSGVDAVKAGAAKVASWFGW